MSTNLIRRMIGVSAIVLVLAPAGCASTTADDHEPEASARSATALSTSTASTRTAPTGAASTTVPQELTAEEQLRVSPPPPQEVSATRERAGVRLTWSPPPDVTVPHTYSDHVVEYRVYRSVDGAAEVLVGTSATLTFTDAAPAAGTSRYAVSSVREHGVEGPRADPVITPPS